MLLSIKSSLLLERVYLHYYAITVSSYQWHKVQIIWFMAIIGMASIYDNMSSNKIIVTPNFYGVYDACGLSPSLLVGPPPHTEKCLIALPDWTCRHNGSCISLPLALLLFLFSFLYPQPTSSTPSILFHQFPGSGSLHLHLHLMASAGEYEIKLV